MGTAVKERLRAVDPLTENLPPGALRDLLGEPQGWWQDALCTQVDPETFFPEKGQSTDAAKAVCRACPAVVECLADALDKRDEDYGVRGAASPKERQRLRRSGVTGALVRASGLRLRGAV